MFRIAFDFDGTIVEHDYPRIGESVPQAVHYLLLFQEVGAELILWTMRSGLQLQEAHRWLLDSGVKIKYINEGIDDRKWTQSPKVYAHLYIDDAAFGCPLIYHDQESRRPYVDWSIVGPETLKQINGYNASRALQ